MARHRAHAKFDRAEWHLRYLIPLWALQIILAVVMLGVFGSQLRRTIEKWQGEDADDRGRFPAFAVAWESVNLALGAAAPILVFAEMFMYFEETLTPRRMMVTQSVTLGVACVALILDIFARVEELSSGKYSILALVIGSVFIITSIVPMLYAFSKHRRLAAYDELNGPKNTKLYGFMDAESQAHLHPNRASMRTMLSDISTPRRLSAASLLSVRRLSGALPAEEVPLQEQAPTTVYSHERDTQFDEYVSARRPNVKDSVDRAMKTEFGWGRSGSPASLGDDLGYKGVLGARGDVHRVPSSAGHSLDAVPETAESDGGRTRRGTETPSLRTPSLRTPSSRSPSESVAETEGSRPARSGPSNGSGLGELGELKVEKKRKNPGD